jgi:hypothetical protein
MLQARYLPTFLSKMGMINRTTATAVQHGPTSLGGSLNGIHLETEQAVEHTKLMISHLRKEDEIGRMIQTSIDQLQMTSWAVLSRPGKKARMYVDQCVTPLTPHGHSLIARNPHPT